jgi:hypothetical protein
MKLLLIMAPTECLEDIQTIVRGHDVHAYTEFPNLLGEGESGGRLGTRAFPGTSSLLMTVLDIAQAQALSDALADFAAQPQNCSRIRVFALPAERLL